MSDFTPLQRLLAFSRPELYRMVLAHVPLVSVVLGVAFGARAVDARLGWAPVLHPPLSLALFGICILGSAAIVYWSYTFLVLEGEGSPAEHIRPTVRVVDTGPYALVRHPTVTGKLLGVLGVGFLFRSPSFLFLLLPLAAAAAAVSNRLTQELPLERRMGEAYRSYRARVPMIFPRPTDLLPLLGRGRRVLFSGLVLLGLAAAVGPASPGRLHPGPGLLLAPLLLLAASTLPGLLLRAALPELGLGRALAFGAGHAFVKEAMLLPHAAFASVARELLGAGAPRAFGALGLGRAALAVVHGGVGLVACAGWLLGRDSTALAVGASFGAWLALGPWMKARLAQLIPFGPVEAGAPPLLAWVLRLAELALGVGAFAALAPVAGLDLPLATVLGVAPLLLFARALPLGWEGVGVQDLVLVLLLAAAGLPAADALGLSFLLHAAFLAARLLGGIGFLGLLPRWRAGAVVPA